MFYFAQGHQLFQRIGLVLLMIQLCLFAFGLPPFHMGIWLQTEPDMVAMYTLGMANALWLLYGVVRRILVQQHSPLLWYVLLAWVAWQVVVTFFAFTPYRSWFGPVEMGEGAAWHLCLVLLVMLATPLWQVKRFRTVLLVWAACVISLESLLHVLFNARDNHYVPGLWIPAQWGAYLAFMVGYFWVMMMVANTVRAPAHWLALIVFTADVIIISHNKTAIALMPFALAVSFGVYLWQQKKGGVLLPSNRWRYAAVFACFVPLVWVVFSAQYTPPEHEEKLESVADYGLLNFSQKDGALGSRVGLIQIGVEAMKHEPRRWLVGNGWGDFTDSMFRYALLPGVHMFEKGERKPNWGFVDGNAYHSHCQPLEALLALGIPGFLLWFAIPAVIMLTIPPRLFWPCVPMLLLMNTTSFFWFTLPQCVPMQAMMLAALCSVCGKGGVPKQRRALSALCLMVVVVVMGITALQQNVVLYYGERLFKGSRYLPIKDYPMDWMLTDVYRGGDHLRVSAMGYAISLDKEHGDLDKRQHDWYARYMQAGHAMMLAPLIGPRGNYLELWLQYKLLLNLGYPMFADLGHEATENMRETVMFMAKAAPKRDDIASFYFLNLDQLTHDDVAMQTEILREMLSVAPEHRSALWVLGNILIKKPTTKDEGEAMIRKAVATRVQDVYAVTDEELKPWK